MHYQALDIHLETEEGELFEEEQMGRGVDPLAIKLIMIMQDLSTVL